MFQLNHARTHIKTPSDALKINHFIFYFQQLKVPVPTERVEIASSSSSGPADKKTDVAAVAEPNQMQLLNLHYEVKRFVNIQLLAHTHTQSHFLFFFLFKRLEETVQTLLPLRHQQSALIQSYEVLK